jgi:hypothetical protein
VRALLPISRLSVDGSSCRPVAAATFFKGVQHHPRARLEHMGFVAVFEVWVGRGRGGVLVATDEADKLQPIEFTLDDHHVRVVPVVVDHEQEVYDDPDDEPVTYLVPFLEILRAEVTIESDATTLDNADIDKFFGRPRNIAAEALRRSLSQLRSITGDVSVNGHA